MPDHPVPAEDTDGAPRQVVAAQVAPHQAASGQAAPSTEDGQPDQPGSPLPSQRTPPLWRRYLRRFSSTGLVVALVFYCFSLTPSLIPRSWLYQGVITGICVAAGYGIGALIEWTVVKVGFRIRWTARVSRVAWWVLAVAAVVLVPLFIVIGVRWQDQIRVLFGMDATGPAHGLGVVLIVLLIALLLLQMARGLRRLVQLLARLVVKVVPLPVARLISVVVVAVLVVMLFNGVIWSGTLQLLNNVYSAANDTIDPELQQPTDDERSGSPQSNESWESLGAAGRQFVATGPSLDDLRTFAAAGQAVDPTEVRTPIRVYAGLNADGDLDTTATDVVAELDRTNAWDRSILVVTTTTGTGWVDPGMSDSLELMHGGDTAIATMQYSYLPSWISFVGDRSTPPAAGKALFEAVYERWSELPENARPRLIAYGISLGSFGAQGAFSGVQDIAQRTDGAMFVGTPSFTPLAAELTADRDPGSLQREPVLDNGEQVRWGKQISNGVDLWQLGDDWRNPRVIYIQHASDGVVWWSPSLLWSRPDWLSEPRGPDVLGAVSWYPIVTFWQLTADLFVAGSAEVPQGHGHNYRPEYADGLAALWAPDGWTPGDTERLKTVVRDRLTTNSG